jgi:hypothetical protein
MQAVAKHSDDILACTEAHVKSSNKNRLSVATVLHTPVSTFIPIHRLPVAQRTESFPC